MLKAMEMNGRSPKRCELIHSKEFLEDRMHKGSFRTTYELFATDYWRFCACFHLTLILVQLHNLLPFI